MEYRVVAIGHERQRKHVQFEAVYGFLSEVAARVGNYLEASVHNHAFPRGFYQRGMALRRPEAGRRLRSNSP